MAVPNNTYEKLHKTYATKVKSLSKAANLVSRLRLLTFVIGLGISIYFYLTNFDFPGHAVLLVTLIVFIFLINKHDRIKRDLQFNRTLLEINHRSSKRVVGDWHEFPDTGIDFKDDAHPYVNDLDIFGQGSLFQWISTANTYLGREFLQDTLKKPLKNLESIRERQEAISELALKLDFRQSFEAYSLLHINKRRNPEHLIKWGRKQETLYLKTWFVSFTRILPLITLSLLLAAALGKIPYVFPSILVLLQFAFVMFFRGGERNSALTTISNYKEDLKMYYDMLYSFETQDFKSALLSQLQQKLKKKGQTAFRQIDKLETLVEWIANRNNAFFLILNILTLWDFHFMYALERWKEQSGRFLENWLKGLAELETLASLSIIRYDQPEWSFPEISKSPTNFRYEAKEIGHPLIHNRVTNDLTLVPPNQVLLITGSNMSGKSTFLRTIGINLVLAYVGAPVCAKHLTCSLFNINTCMRISDNLEQNISSFYAEILRIKGIVEAATREDKVFFLLDEIFKGTNSVDRHAGAQLLIKRLIAEGAMGLVSTHDLELGVMEQNHGSKVRNYHFREYYVNDEIKFDYQLRPGISTTRNAMYLIKMAGITSKS